MKEEGDGAKETEKRLNIAELETERLLGEVKRLEESLKAKEEEGGRDMK